MSSRTLPDGTYIPSHLRLVSKSKYEPNSDIQFRNFALRVGYVVAAYAPFDEANKSGKHWEYDVSVTQTDNVRSAFGTAIYYNCRVMNLFGGMGDFTSYTLRAPTREVDSPEKIGSVVFLLCENGNSNYAHIIGSPSHPCQQPSVGEHHYQFQFNGFEFFIGENGAVFLTREGPVDESGSPIGPRHGQSIQLPADGTITITDGDGQGLHLGNGQGLLSAASSVTVTAPSIYLGSDEEARSPILCATDSYVSSSHTLHDAMKTFLGGVRDLCNGIIADPMIAAPKAPAAALLPIIVQLELALDQHDQTLSTNDAISTVTFSE